MTDLWSDGDAARARRDGRSTLRWSAGLALAPAAAAVFAATTTWSATHPPAPQPVATDPGSAATSSADLQQALDDETARVDQLRSRVARLQRQASALGKGAGGGSGAAAASGSSPRQASGTARGSGGTSRTVTRAPAPATHTTTGGS